MPEPSAGGARTLRRILIWGRGARLDGAYSRDRVVYRLLSQLGATLEVFPSNEFHRSGSPES